jgi:hypothetical protein
MTTIATVYATGQLSDTVVAALDDPALYDNATAGIPVITIVIQASTARAINDLADALGVVLGDPSTFFIDLQKVRFPVLHQVVVDHLMEGYVEDFETLSKNGFVFFFHLS